MLVYFLLVLGLAMVVVGADILVDGSSSIARRAGISEFVIGLTIVGFGTSCPELVVSLTGAVKHLPDISAGNVIGSNIFNTLLILGVTAMIAPIGITGTNRKADIPMTVFVTLVLVFFGLYNADISRIEGILFLLIFAGYMVFCFKNGRRDPEPADAGDGRQKGLWLSIAFVVLGLAGLVIGGRVFVDSATQIARTWGVSDKFIAVTVLAGGTSLPELATCIVAAARKKGQLALGNILGSNIFNILLVLGLSATVNPIAFGSINGIDLAVLTVSALLVFTSSFTARKNVLDRVDASLLLIVAVAYFWYLVAGV